VIKAYRNFRSRREPRARADERVSGDANVTTSWRQDDVAGPRWATARHDAAGTRVGAGRRRGTALNEPVPCQNPQLRLDLGFRADVGAGGSSVVVGYVGDDFAVWADVAAVERPARCLGQVQR